MIKSVSPWPVANLPQHQSLREIVARTLTMSLWAGLWLVSPGRLQAQEVVFANGFEPALTEMLDCEKAGYPCSLGEADPAARDRTLQLLQILWGVRRAGNMDDVRVYLASQPDVLEVDGNRRFVSFRVEGMSPAIFDDPSAVPAKPPSPGGISSLGKNDRSFLTASSPPGDAPAGQITGQSTVEAVVGEDNTGDSKIDQRDIKRALVLAPYEWDFSPNDESSVIATRLELLPAYAGNVTLKMNPDKQDQNITIDDWLSLGNYDVVAIATHGSRKCPEEGQDMPCLVWVSSGVIYNAAVPQHMSLKGARFTVVYDEEDAETPAAAQLSLTTDFFRNFYAGTLDNQLLTFAACETAGAFGGELAAALGGDDFVMTGWTEAVDVGIAFQTALAFYEELAKGVTAQEAFDHVADLDLFPYVDADGFSVDFEILSPRGDDVRITELPQLLYEGAEIPEGVNIIDLVEGMTGDAIPDRLNLTLQIEGVTPDAKPDFRVRYRIQDQGTVGSYDLSSAALMDGYEYRYEVTHNVDLGFPLVVGDVPIEVIVELPEGGDSRYSTTAFVASCYFTANVSGDTTALFDGPAQFEIGGDGAINVRLRSRGYINADPSASVLASLFTGPAHPLQPGTDDVASADINFTMPVYSAVYLPGIQGSDCPTCGGSMTIESYQPDQSTSGSASVTMVRVYPPPQPNELPPVTLDVNFVAAFGSEFEGDSPYVQCANQYGD